MMTSAPVLPNPVRLYRSMMAASDGFPLTQPTARALGARPEIDIPIANGLVRPGHGGLSVSPHSPLNLPRHRGPAEFGGTGKDLIWSVDVRELGADLTYRPVPDNPLRHGYMELATTMSFDDYQRALSETRRRWARVIA